MRIGLLTNGKSNEAEMQTALRSLLLHLGITFSEEVHVPEIHRRADFLLIKKRGLVNVEAKCTNFKKMLEQLDNHASYCDYSFAYIPDYAPTPKWFKSKLRKRGYGLIIYSTKYDVATEVFEAHHNEPKNKKLRSKMLLEVRIPKLAE